MSVLSSHVGHAIQFQESTVSHFYWSGPTCQLDFILTEINSVRSGYVTSVFTTDQFNLATSVNRGSLVLFAIAFPTTWSHPHGPTPYLTWRAALWLLHWRMLNFCKAFFFSFQFYPKQANNKKIYYNVEMTK